MQNNMLLPTQDLVSAKRTALVATKRIKPESCTIGHMQPRMKFRVSLVLQIPSEVSNNHPTEPTESCKHNYLAGQTPTYNLQPAFRHATPRSLTFFIRKRPEFASEKLVQYEANNLGLYFLLENQIFETAQTIINFVNLLEAHASCHFLQP
jgi:hypothetical protein